MNIHKELCKLVLAISIYAVCGALCLSGCNATGTRHTYFGLGSALTVMDFADNAALDAYCRDLLADIQAAVDITDPQSDIARFNAAPDEEKVAVDTLAYHLVCEARRCYDITEGRYDATAYWSVDLWGFLPRAAGTSMPYDRAQNADGGYPLPDAQYIEAFRALTDMRRIEAIAEESTGKHYLIKHDSATVVEGVTYYARLDLGGIAKGYAVACLQGYIDSHGIKKGYFDFGSSSLLLLANRKGAAWDLSLTHPRKEGTYCTMPAKNLVVSTSGDYQNYYMLDGVRYCHIIDTATGCPTQSDILTVSVLGEDATLLDALSTALMAGGMAYLRTFMESEAGHNLRIMAVYLENGRERVFGNIDTATVKY